MIIKLKCDGGAAGVSSLKSELTGIIQGMLHRHHGILFSKSCGNPEIMIIFCYMAQYATISHKPGVAP